MILNATKRFSFAIQIIILKSFISEITDETAEVIELMKNLYDILFQFFFCRKEFIKWVIQGEHALYKTRSSSANQSLDQTANMNLQRGVQISRPGWFI